jgi:uncharacterized protein YraI
MLLAVVALVFLSISSAHAFLPAQDAAVTVTVTAGANLREGPGTTYAKIGSAAAGSTVQVTGCNADCTWYQVASGAWIAAELLSDPPELPRVGGQSDQDARQPVPSRTMTPTASSLATATPPASPGASQRSTNFGAVALANANLRSGPGTTFARIGTVQADEALQPVGQTAQGDWLQLADGSWIAAFLVEYTGDELPVIIVVPTPEAAALPPASTPEPALAVASPASQPARTRDLLVEFINPHYNCEQGEYEFEDTQGIVEKIWAYRSFQVDMYITNNGADPIEPTWNPTRWIITDGLNAMINDRMWQWISRYSGKYPQPTIFPGQKAGWTWVAMPVGIGEWVKAVEFEHDGQLYRQEFDLGPYGNAYNYINCGEPRVHKDYPTPTPRPRAGS